jgi:transcriptional regulator with XRE-family HTH domain
LKQVTIVCMTTTGTQLPPPADSVGERIKQVRGYARMTGAALGAAVGVSRETVSSWENDRTSPTATELLRIARTTGFPAGWFLDGLDEIDVTAGKSEVAMLGERRGRRSPVPASLAA